MSVAMGGDETGGCVGDVGTAVAKFGVGGEDAPKGDEPPPPCAAEPPGADAAAATAGDGVAPPVPPRGAAA